MFEVESVSYPSAEHWMMASKARLFGDEKMLLHILEAKSPAEAKALGHKVKNFEPQRWNKHKFKLVKEGNIHKFSQHQDMKTFLLATKNRILVEASPYDKIWGIGLSQNTPNIENPHTWKGQNLLGYALMEVRDLLLTS